MKGMEPEPLKLYFDYKSPFAYLAAEPAFALPEKYAVALRWIPLQLRIKGKGERSLQSEWKARYSYLDARRWANRRGGFPIRGPKKVYDSRPALIGGLFAEREGCFRPFTLEAYARFFDHRLELDLPDDVARCIEDVAGAGAGERYLAYLAGEGAHDYEAAQEEAHADHVFGVPLFLFRGEPFWGHDRMALLEERLAEAGLRR
jgi:2-hydroxychromene-2-carboxylate isomerase